MDYKYIEQLLDRYFLGETTLHEEQILKAFFAQGGDDMPAQLAQYAPLFAVLAERPMPGEDFARRMEEAVGQQSAAATPVPVRAHVVSLGQRLRPLFGAAATVAILLTLGGAINQAFTGQDDTWIDADEYARRAVAPDVSAPAVAYEQAADTLSAGSMPLTPDRSTPPAGDTLPGAARH